MTWNIDPRKFKRKKEMTIKLYVGFLNKDGVEVSDGSYTRQLTELEKEPDGRFYNKESIIFPEATTDWGLITNVGLWKKSSDIEPIITTLLRSPHCICSGNTVTISIKQINIDDDIVSMFDNTIEEDSNEGKIYNPITNTWSWF